MSFATFTASALAAAFFSADSPCSTAVTYTGPDGATAEVYAVLGPESSETEILETGRRRVRTRDCHVSLDADAGIPAPSPRGTVTVDGEIWSIRDDVTLRKSAYAAVLPLVIVEQVARQNRNLTQEGAAR